MFAYLDPATGSMILSAVAGGIAGIAVVFRTFGHRVWSTITFWKKDEAETPTDEPPAEVSSESVT